jgi:hypothetical protein
VVADLRGRYILDINDRGLTRRYTPPLLSAHRSPGPPIPMTLFRHRKSILASEIKIIGRSNGPLLRPLVDRMRMPVSATRQDRTVWGARAEDTVALADGIANVTLDTTGGESPAG